VARVGRWRRAGGTETPPNRGTFEPKW